MALLRHEELEARQHRGRHGSPEARIIAEGNTILRVRAGSVVYGTSTGGGDTDEVGVCIPPPQYVAGLKRISPFDDFWPGEYFQLYQHHTAWEREGGIRNKSGDGDLDLTVYSLRHFLELALGGNPSILEKFFTPAGHVIQQAALGLQLRELYPLVVSREAGPRYLGYLRKQREALMSREGRGRDVTRSGLVERHGYDVKFAAHMVRLGYQGIELMGTGRITLPMPDHERQVVMDIRQGRATMEVALAIASDLEEELLCVTIESGLPAQPDHELVDQWLIEAHQRHWHSTGWI